MNKWFKKVAVVTGASEGIGKDISLKLVEHGVIVVGCGRYLNKLEEVKKCIPKDSKGEFVPFKCDVSNEEEVRKMFNFVKSTYKELSICINNAGIYGEGSILQGKTEVWKKMLDVNVLGLCMCTREAFNLMKENERSPKPHECPGHIINICSMLGHHVLNFSNFHFYTASKFAVNAISQGIQQELGSLKSGIRVSQISPGAVDTKFESNAGTTPLENIGRLNASDVTDAVLHVLSAPSHVAVADVLIWPTKSGF